MARLDNASDRRQEINARLTALGAEQEERLAQRRADKFRLPYVNLFSFPMEPGDLALLPIEKAKELAAVLFYKQGTDVRMGVVNPDLAGFDELVGQVEKSIGAKVQVHIISHHSLRVALSRYPEGVKGDNLLRDEIAVSESLLSDPDKALEEVKQVGVGGKTMVPTDLLAAIIAGAMARRVSDIHIEPGVDRSQLRYRIDGVLADVLDFDREAWAQVLSRLKVLAKMKLNVRDMPQDGSFVVKSPDGDVDVRLSVLPGGLGEYIVMRLLGRNDLDVTLDKLGMKKRDYDVVMKELRQSTGMILTSGPTGSGKTTTIAACLKEVVKPELKVISLEDPIEYRIPGVEQTQVEADAGYTFAVGLRSILRQDPDIVFVGEMRDAETVETSVHAALTGHLVFSTIHSNDAPGALLRLINIGTKPYVLAPALNLVIAQRLVRLVCRECAVETEVSVRMRDHIEDVMEGVANEVFDPAVLKSPKLRFMEAKGCEKCSMTGYKGRVGVYEVFAVNGEIEELILQSASITKIRDAAMRSGMTTIAQDAYLKVIDGLTTVDEVGRVSSE